MTEEYRQDITVTAYEGTDPQVLSDLLFEAKTELMRKLMAHKDVTSPAITSSNSNANMPRPTKFQEMESNAQEPD